MATYNAIKYNVDYGGFAGALMPLATFTSDGSDSTASFTSGIDSTYKEYIFKCIDIHPGNDDVRFTFQADTGTNTNYNQTITSTNFAATPGEMMGDALPRVTLLPPTLRSHWH